MFLWGSFIGLTSNAIDHERVQLFLAMLALAGKVGDGLHLTVEQVVQQCQGHFLCRATVGANVQHVCLRYWAAYAHLRVVLVTKPRSCWIVLYGEKKKMYVGIIKTFFPNVHSIPLSTGL